MKKILFLFLAAFLSLTAFSQAFLNGLGIVGFVQGASGRPSVSAGGLTYNPRFNFLEMENSSLSVGIPMSFALSGSVNYNTSYGYSNSSSVSAMINLPLIVNYNFGAGATREPGQKFGFFVGAGAAYHLSEHDYDDDEGYSYTDKVNGFGPAGNIGVRFGVGRRSKNIELRFSYMKVMDDSKSGVGGLAAIFNF